MPVANKDLKDLKVLLVEDDYNTTNLIRRMLLDLGVSRILCAADGRKALEVLGSREGRDMVNVVLCDWNMPVMSGLEVLKQVRAGDPELPFLMITGVADANSVAEAKALAVTGYIKKPFSSGELGKKLGLVRRLLSARETVAA